MDDSKLDVKQLVTDAAAKFREEHVAKSYSQRHLELGKMLNCKVCSRRHRSSIVCEQRILVPAAQTRKGIYGAQSFAKKRLCPHHSHKLLQLVQLTQALFPKYYPRIEDPEKAMKAARGEARITLLRGIRAVRNIQTQMRHRSRQINAGLVGGGIR